MKHLFIFFSLYMVIPLQIFAQASAMTSCYTPGVTIIAPIPDTAPGFSPRQNFMHCAIQGQPTYDTLYLTNYSSFSFSGIPVTMDSLRIDSIYTPSGLCWQTSSPTNTIGSGATGVVLISGTTNDSAGQYKLRIIMTAFTNFGAFVENAESVDLIYKLRIQNGNVICSCPPIDNTRADSALVFIPYPACVLTATISPSASDTICQGDSITLTANSGLGFTYLWSDSAHSTTSSIRVADSGQYTVTLYYAGDTSVSAPTNIVVVNTPGTTLMLTGSDSICPGTIDTIAAPQGADYTYRWNTHATSQSIYVNAPGTFTVTVTTPNGCTAISSPQTITNRFICPGPPVAQVTITGRDTICPGDSIILSALSGYGYTFRWSDPTHSTTDSITATTGGVYYVTVYHAGDSTVSAPTTIIVDTPGTNLSLIGSANLCTGDSVTISAPAGLAYQWNNHDTTRSITPHTSGSYTVTVTNRNQCTAVSSPQVITAIHPADTITISGSVLTSQTASSYQWYDGNNPLQGDTNKAYTATQNGSYFVIIWKNGCAAISNSITVTGVGINDISRYTTLRLYPNPSEGIFTLEAPDCVGKYYEITDEFGRVILKKIIQAESTLIDLSDQLSGIYYLTMKNSPQNETVRLVLIK